MTDFVFVPSYNLEDLGTTLTKYENNLAALRILKELEAEGRGEATLHEQTIMSKYVGWGDSALLRRAFPGGAASSQLPPAAELKELLSEDEVRALRASSLNAHYTAIPVIRAIYAGLLYVGLNRLRRENGARLRVLEPAAGIGHFIGAMPPELKERSDWAAVELDSLSARITKLLYPSATVYAEGFESANLPPDWFDLVISNVPFGNYKVCDASFKEPYLRAAIHDYYFAKALRVARPGGVIAFITSRFTLDKQDTRLRAHLATHAELLAAARLPNNAFAANAGAEVVTDIIILRKRSSPDKEAAAREAWVGADDTTVMHESGTPMSVMLNRLMIADPKLMLGRPVVAQHGMYGRNEFTVKPDGRDLAGSLRQTLERILPANMLAPELPAGTDSAPEVSAQTNAGRAEPERERLELSLQMELSEVSAARAGFEQARATHLVEIYTAAKNVIRVQMEGGSDEGLSEAQGELNRLYDRFRVRYGYINSKQNLSAFRRDNGLFAFLRALEEPASFGGQFRKTPLFTKRTIRPVSEKTSADNAHEALLLCLNESGRVDLARIAALCRKDVPAVTEELRGLVFQTPGGCRVTRDEYLSGNVRARLIEAEAAARLDGAFKENVEALKAAQPAPLGAGEITARLGAAWVPVEVVEAFARFLVPRYRGKVRYLEPTAQWIVDPPSSDTAISVEATQTWGTQRVHALDILEDALNLRRTVVYDQIDERTRVVNQTETVAAQAKLQDMKEKFQEWVWQDARREGELCRLYNEQFNTTRERRYDGSHLTLPGASTELELRPHQKDAVWRILQSKTTLIGHSVGAGKAQPLTAQVLTPEGWKLMGEIKVGDQVIAGDGTATEVVGVYPQGVKEIYRVTFSDGATAECCDEHLWKTATYRERETNRMRKTPAVDTGRVRPLSEIRNTLLAYGRVTNHKIPMVGRVEFEPRDIELDPYLLGALIGDGGMSTRAVCITCNDAEVVGRCEKVLPAGVRLTRIAGDKAQSYRLTRLTAGAPNPVTRALARLGLRGKTAEGKFVPDAYKFNTPEVRLAVLQGLMDTDGTVDRRGTSVYFASSSKRLAEDVQFLAQSFGGVATITSRLPTYTHNGEKRTGRESYVVSLSLPPSVNPFRLARKAEKVIPKTKYQPARYITDVRRVGRKEARCIAVAHPEHLYVTDDFVVTHNTLTSVAAAHELRRLGLARKSMIVVPKHVVPQWAQEAQRLYPGLKMLTTDAKDFTRQMRGETMSRIATGDWDLIIVPHPSFKLLPVRPETANSFINEEIERLRDHITELQSEDGRQNRRSIKQLEKTLKRFEAKLKTQNAEIRRDDAQTVTFEELGVEALFVDECFTYETLVLTDRGLLQIGEIVENRLPVKVLACDTSTGRLGWKPGVRWLPKKLTGALVRVTHEHGSFTCTPNHKIWTEEDGYVCAGSLRPHHYVRVLPGIVRAAGAEQSPQAETILQPEMCGASEARKTGILDLPSLPDLIPTAPRKVGETVLRQGLSDGSAQAGNYEGVPLVPERVLLPLCGGGEQRQPPLLRQPLRLGLEDGPAGEAGEIAQGVRESAGRLLAREEASGSLGAHEAQQPDERPGRSGEGQSGQARAHFPLTRRQRPTDRTPDAPGGEVIPAHRIPDPDEAGEGAVPFPTHLLQGGHGGPGDQAGHRSGRADSQVEEVEIPRPAEGVGLASARVVGVEVLEPAGDGGFGGSRGGDRTVYDLEVADHHNYFADGVLVSNCHIYKNLYFSTKMSRVAGLANSESQQAFDMFVKTQWLLGEQGRVIFLTGTPVSNTLCEVWIMMRYLQLDLLRELGMDHFDAWAQAFAETTTGVEMRPDGSGFRVHTRFNKFVNLPELSRLWRLCLDVRTPEQLNLPRPAVAGGSPVIVSVPASPELIGFVGELSRRSDKVRTREIHPSVDNMLKITSEGRKAALDMRLVKPELGELPFNKIDAVVERVGRIYHRSAGNRGAQMIFCDLATPKGRGGSGEAKDNNESTWEEAA